MSNDVNKFTSKYTLNVEYLNKTLELSILSNSFNTYTAYHIDRSVYNICKSKYNLNISFDISRNLFTTTFLDISSYKNDGIDQYNKFNAIYTQYKDVLYYDKKQSIVFDKIVKNGTFLENKLDIYILRLYKFKDSFLYCICNRQHVNPKTYKNTIRSSSFCIYTRDCYMFLQNLFKKYKSSGSKIQTTEDAITSLFDNSCDLNPQQLRNGITL